ncbi:MAG: citrate/2-methylcitrate synthase, partial [Candidatus Caldarchaeum sp.]
MSSSGVYKGLDNLPIKETVLSTIDGEKGKLYYVGYSVEELAEKSTYEEVCFLLLNHRLPSGSELADFTSRLVEERRLHPDVWSLLSRLPPEASLMNKLKLGVDLLALYDKEADS